MNWTNSQIDAKDTLQIWLDSSIVIQSDHFRCLEGPAGSGKSTVVEAIIENFPKNKILGAAPTHTAKDILIEFSKLQAVTVHQLLGLKPDIALEFYNPANPIYAQLNPDYFEKSSLDLIIIDESSMLNASIVTMIKERALETGKKVLFIGDRLQLPPINETISTVFTTVEVISLTEIVRQSGSNPVNEMISLAREDAQNGTDQFHSYITRVAEESPCILVTSEYGIEEGFIVSKNKEDTKITLKDKLYSLFSTTNAIHDYKFVKIVAYTNEKVKAYNKLIKSVINKSDLPVSEGDWLLGYSPFKVKQKALTQNGMYYKCLNARLGFSSYTHIDGQSRTVVQLKIINTTLRYKQTLDNGTVKDIDFTLKILHPDSYEDYIPILTKEWQNGTIYRRWKNYYTLMESFALLDDFSFTGTDERGNTKKFSMAKKHIDLGYAITVHKSQGCTFNNVYMDYENFSRCFDVSTRRRLNYVAVSRTKAINMVYG
jgi:exodeoxyribonuclease-5